MNDVPNEIKPRVETRDPLIASLLANFAFIRDSAKDQARSIKNLAGSSHLADMCSVHSPNSFYRPFFQGPGLANTRIFPFWILLELRMMELAVTTGAIRRAKASVKSLSPTQQGRSDALPFAQTTVSEH